MRFASTRFHDPEPAFGIDDFPLILAWILQTAFSTWQRTESLVLEPLESILPGQQLEHWSSIPLDSKAAGSHGE